MTDNGKHAVQWSSVHAYSYGNYFQDDIWYNGSEEKHKICHLLCHWHVDRYVATYSFYRIKLCSVCCISSLAYIMASIDYGKTT